MAMSEFVWPVRVYYEDTDFGGVVYYANYLKFMERARTEWLRALGFEQTELIAAYEVMFVVRRVAVEYLQQARFKEELRGISTVKRLGQGRSVFAQNIVRDNLLVGGETEVACVSSLSFKPVKIPDNLLQALEKIA